MDTSVPEKRVWLPSGQAERRSGLPRRTLITLARRGEIIGIQPVRNWKFDEASLEAYLRGHHRREAQAS